VITPHLGEMSRLTGRPAAELDLGRIDCAREWAARWGVVVVLKGAPTVVAAPDGRASVNPTGNPGLATAGTGDVLSGIIGALLSKGLGPFEAAAAGTLVHARAGIEAAKRIGGADHVVAGDVIDAVPAAFAR
jgi:NAD(P)H-hydrate epimerase